MVRTENQTRNGVLPSTIGVVYYHKVTIKLTVVKGIQNNLYQQYWETNLLEVHLEIFPDLEAIVRQDSRRCIFLMLLLLWTSKKKYIICYVIKKN